MKISGMTHLEFANRFKTAVSASVYANATQKELGEWLGVSQTTVNYWLLGERLPSMKTAIKIAGKLRCNVDWLMTGRNTEAKPVEADPVLAFIERATRITKQALAEEGSDLTEDQQFDVYRTVINLNKSINISDDDLKAKIKAILTVL